MGAEEPGHKEAALVSVVPPTKMRKKSSYVCVRLFPDLLSV